MLLDVVRSFERFCFYWCACLCNVEIMATPLYGLIRQWRGKFMSDTLLILYHCSMISASA